MLLHCCVDRVRHGQRDGRINLEVRRKRRIIPGDNGDSGWGQTYTISAKCAIVTAPVAVLASGRIAFDPPLSSEDSLALFRGRNMYPATKLLLHFSRRCWPAKLYGTVMAGAGIFVPEAWFKEDENGRCVATGFLTAEYANNLERETAARLGLTSPSHTTTPAVEQMMCRIFLEQLDEVFFFTGTQTHECCCRLRLAPESVLGGWSWSRGIASRPTKAQHCLCCWKGVPLGTRYASFYRRWLLQC